VNFMGKDQDPADGVAAGTGVVRKRSGGPGANPSLGQERNRSSGRASSPVLPGTALGRRLGVAAAEAAHADMAGTAAGGATDYAPGQTSISGEEAQLGLNEVDLLRQPLIQATGGISGLGVSQLSDSDSFSCVVKFLLDFDRFKEVRRVYHNSSFTRLREDALSVG
jgi:hypothetical protein